jgi:tRNA threonylcarbamoyladenosine biosynthesis protein TsaE
MNIITKNPAQTQNIGLRLAKKLKGGEILGLGGELGSGKTCFVKGLARGLGAKQLITSPSFVFLRVLPTQKNKKIKYLIHLDLYRLKNKGGINNIIPWEYFSRKDVVFVIEWIERIKKRLPKKIRLIKFKILGLNQREIII